MADYINKITATDGTTYDIKDTVSGYAPIASPTFTGTPAAPTASAGTNTTQIATTAFVKTAVDTAVTGSVAYKGVVNDPTDISGLASFTAGWYWIIGTAGTYCGEVCEAGDMIFCNTTGTTYDAQYFDIVQTNIDTMSNTDIDSIVAQ